MERCTWMLPDLAAINVGVTPEGDVCLARGALRHGNVSYIWFDREQAFAFGTAWFRALGAAPPLFDAPWPVGE